MRTSELVRNLAKYLPVLVVLAATVTGMLLGKDLYPTLVASQSTTPSSGEINSLQRLPIPGAVGSCSPALIYTSLPPKCRTFEGKFIPLPGASPYFLLPPERK